MISGRGTRDLLSVGDLRFAGALLHVPALVRHQEADGQVGNGKCHTLIILLIMVDEFSTVMEGLSGVFSWMQ